MKASYFNQEQAPAGQRLLTENVTHDELLQRSTSLSCRWSVSRARELPEATPEAFKRQSGALARYLWCARSSHVDGFIQSGQDTKPQPVTVPLPHDFNMSADPRVTV